MIEIGNWAKKGWKWLKGLDYTSGAMRYVLWYALLLVFVCLLYVGAWCAMWYVDGRPKLDDLLKFLHEIASASWVAVIGFVGKAFVDANNDGIPDEFQREDDKK